MRWAVDRVQPEGRDRRDLRADDDERAVTMRASSSPPCSSPPAARPRRRRRRPARRAARRRRSTTTASSPPIRTIRRAFTQGLFYLDGQLYESTGQVGQSTIRRVNIDDGRVLQSVPIPPGQFGEGIVNWGDQIVSITWTERHRLSLGPAHAAPARRMALSGRRLGPDPERHRHRHERRHRRASLPRPRDPGRAPPGHGHRRRPAGRRGSTSSNGSRARSSPTSGRPAIIVRIDPATGRVTGVIDLGPLAAAEQRRRGRRAERHRL